MESPPPIPADLTLYCPNCAYNLTGLAEPRCPECGREFDAAQLALEIVSSPRRLTVGKFLAHLLWMPALFCGSTIFFLVIEEEELAMVALSIFGLGLLIGAPLNGLWLASRLRPPRHISLARGKSPAGAGYVIGVGLALMCCHYVLAVGGCGLFALLATAAF